MLSTFFVLSALLAAPAFAQTPSVSLLIDLPSYATTGDIKIRELLPFVQIRKFAPFRFGSTYDVFSNTGAAAFTNSVYSNVFNHMVAENGCKWYDTEPTRGVSNLTDCKAAQKYAFEHLASFRLHNTFWHQQTPSWLPGNVTADDLVKNIIPQHVKQEIGGMGPLVTSVDVMNELIGDNPPAGSSALQCVQSKDTWPSFVADGSKTPLVKDLSFIDAAFGTAYKTASPLTRLSYNDYSTGGNDNKTACVFQLIDYIHNTVGVPYNRLAVGFQSHVTARPYWFPSKADLKANFAKLANLGVDAYITEIDIQVISNATIDARYQASIWGDYLDTCLHASNCHEFINWDTRDDESWITSGLPTLFDATGKPKLAAYEVQARFQRYITGAAELCATSAGAAACKVTA